MSIHYRLEIASKWGRIVGWRASRNTDLTGASDTIPITYIGHFLIIVATVQVPSLDSRMQANLLFQLV